jgi:hypothetical protein
MDVMLWSNALLAGLISMHAATPAASGSSVYKVELSGNQTVWSEDQPRNAGALVLFHRYPGGLLVSVKKTDVRRVTAVPRVAEELKRLKTGKDVVLGSLPDRPSSGSGATAGSALPEGAALSPGERKDGTALLNPDRSYRPSWDSKQVPGQSLPFPASPNDYREGRTFAYPPAGAVQEAPGEPPKMAPGNGEPPKGPQ